MGASARIIVCSRCGRTRPHGSKGRCGSCAVAVWREGNRDRSRAWFRAYQKRWREAHPDKISLATAKRRERDTWEMRARQGDGKVGRREALSIEFLTRLRAATPNCACCGTPLVFAVNKRGERAHNSASLDKIVPAAGYIESNVAIICSRCNRRKQDSTAEELRQIVAYIERHLKKAS